MLIKNVNFKLIAHLRSTGVCARLTIVERCSSVDMGPAAAAAAARSCISYKFVLGVQFRAQRNEIHGPSFMNMRYAYSVCVCAHVFSSWGA